ncbi:MAG: hypothetical protein ABFD25_19240 [Clostridiaceae bacterium]
MEKKSRYIGVSNTPNSGVFGITEVKGKIYILGGWNRNSETPLDIKVRYRI